MGDIWALNHEIQNSMRILREKTAGLIIDIQERLYPHMHENEALARNTGVLINGMKVLGLPLLVTQQYTRGLGPTIPGLLEMVIVDSHKAEFWITVFDKLKYHPEIFIRDGGKTAAAFRKNSPKLEGILNEFMKQHRQGTLMGNIVLNQYLVQ